VALACHVVLYRPQNAGGLLWRRIARKLSPVVTQDDEDAARHRLTRSLYGEGAASPRDVPPETQARRTDEQ
jgi:hypothetical protein